MRKILFEKEFDSEEFSSLYFSGPSSKDGSYAISVGCPHCCEDIDIPLSITELKDLESQIRLALNSLETK